MILNAISGKPLPVYGKGEQIRDWLFVDDHARALYTVVTQANIGETYNIGGHNERKNIQVVETICELLEELHPQKPAGVAKYRDLITYVTDRPAMICVMRLMRTKLSATWAGVRRKRLSPVSAKRWSGI